MMTEGVLQDHPDPQVESVLATYAGTTSNLIPVLQAVQNALGYLPATALKQVAAHVAMPLSEVYGVVTFYAQFYLTPQGKHKVKVCQGTACHVKGASDIIAAISRRFDVVPGESTADFELTLESVACFGSCALAPVMVVDEKVYGNVTPDAALEILEALS